MRELIVAILIALLPAPAVAQVLAAPASESDLPKLATAFVAEEKHAPDLNALFRAQFEAGAWREGLTTLETLRAPLARDPSPRLRARLLEYAIYARAKLRAADGTVPFDVAYGDAFRATLGALDNRTSAILAGNLSFDNLSQAERAVKQDLDGLKGKTDIAPAGVAQLVRDANDRNMYRAVAPLTPKLIAEDDARRYTIAKDFAVRLSTGGTVCVLVVRPRTTKRLPALLQFTIYNDAGALMREARRAASNDYAGVIGLTRGKGCSPDAIVPYEHDGEDAAALVEWIAAQSWSDGQVGMYGGSYSGFTPWAAAKHRPKALKAILVGAANAPGIDAPMEGNVFWNFPYPWPFYTTGNKTLDNATYNDSARWARLNHNWYVSGRAYRDLDRIDGTPNPLFDRWIAHPSYDAYWQTLIPYTDEWADIDIPVLQTAGYYFGGPGAAVYYLSQHLKYRPDAQHYLVIGPYDHFMAQRGTAGPDGDIDTLAGMKLDPAALIDMRELWFRWFDYVLKGGPKPEMLADRINYEVTGANLWKHAPTLAAMANAKARYFLSGEKEAGALRLSGTRPPNNDPIPLVIDLADRRDVDAQTPGGGVEDKALDTTNGLEFLSDPLSQAMEASGLFSGHLEFTVNKRDFDFQIALYELTANGEYIQLAPYWLRASYAGDLTHRRLLTPGKRETIDFTSVRLMSRQLAPGSRLVMVLSGIKEPDREITYGTGGVVEDETIKDAKMPLKIAWYPGSYIDLPVMR